MDGGAKGGFRTGNRPQPAERSAEPVELAPGPSRVER